MFRSFRSLLRYMLAIIVMMSAVSAGAALVQADEADQVRAREAMLRGEVEPLTKALEVIEKNFQGDIIEVELEEEDKFGTGPTLIYEMKLLTPTGDVLKIKLHAKNLNILTVDGNEDFMTEIGEYNH